MKQVTKDTAPATAPIDNKDALQYNINITGEGKPVDIIKALRLIANAIESKEVRETLDSPKIEDLNGAQWQDCTLTTEINKL